MRIYGVLGLMLIGCSGALYAQFAPPSGGCPPGMHLQGFACVYDSAPSAPAPPRAMWETRWGAIAIGRSDSDGGFGTSTNAKSKRRAEAAAVKQCRQTGGPDSQCKVFSYYNQCAVVAWGLQSYTIQSAENADIAAQLALKLCSERTDDCQIFYSACSFAERVR